MHDIKKLYKLAYENRELLKRLEKEVGINAHTKYEELYEIVQINRIYDVESVFDEVAEEENPNVFEDTCNVKALGLNPNCDEFCSCAVCRFWCLNQLLNGVQYEE